MAGETLRDVELFASGTYRGREYTAADVDEIAANAAKLKAVLDPPAVVGHEEDSAAPERTDVPADGWVDPATVRAEWRTDQAGTRRRVLVGTITDVPPETADRIRARRLRKISAEVYDDFTDDHGVGHGKALRRVSFLGGEVPQVKSIADLPMPSAAFAERWSWTPGEARKTASGTYVCFAEVTMTPPTPPAPGGTRDQNKALVMAAMPGLMPPTIDAMSDDQIADLAKNAPQPPAQTVTPSDSATPPPGAPVMTRDELIAALEGLGEPAEALQPLTDEELQALYDEMTAEGGDAEAAGAAPMADEGAMTHEQLVAAVAQATGQDPNTLAALSDDELKALLSGGPAGAAAVPPAAAAMGERSKPGRAMTFAERADRMARRRYLRERVEARQAKERGVESFCEELVRTGRVLPAQLGPIRAHLLSASDGRVETFQERGKTVTATPFARAKAAYLAYPPVHLAKFGEKVPGAGGASDPQAAAERETNAVARFAEVHATPLRAAGYAKPEHYVQKFSEARKKRPDLTAAEYGVPAEYYA